MKILKNKNKIEKKVYNVDPNELIIRDHLAVDRTALANERTLLAYARTALAFAAGGAGLIKIWPLTVIIVFGSILITIGVITLIIGMYRFFKTRKMMSDIGCQNLLLDINSDESK